MLRTGFESSTTSARILLSPAAVRPSAGRADHFL
jgi:hypothetical protein